MVIYKATNTVNGKCYIGKTTVGLYRRRVLHKSSSKIRTKQAFYRAINKYGWDAFVWEVVDDTCVTNDELNVMELHYIKQYHSHGNDNGYNMTWGGDGGPVMYGDDNPSRRPEKMVYH